MSSITQIIILDEVRCRINPCSAQLYRLIDNATKLFDYRSKFTTAYQQKMFDGYKRYINVGGYTYIKLLPIITDIMVKQNVQFEIIDNRKYKDFHPEFPKIDESFMSEYHWPKGHRLAGQPIMLEKHQVRSINSLMSVKKGLLEASTGSGKTAILACMGSLIKAYGKCLIVVPGSDLVLQTYDTLHLMGVDAGRFMGEEYRELDHQTVIATWQTIMWDLSYAKGKKLNGDPVSPELQERAINELNTLTDNLIAIICDEVQCLTGRQIFKQFTETFAFVPLRYGMTGTIPKSEVDKRYLSIAIGDKVEEVTTKELQDINFLAQSHITILKLIESFDPLKGLSKVERRNGKSWAVEKKYLTTDTKRKALITDLIRAISSSGNVLVLGISVDMGIDIADELKAKGVDSLYISSKISSTKRQKLYKTVTPTSNRVLVSTLQLASTGIDIPALHKVVLIDSGKAFTKTIQAIGRGLRLAEGKTSVEIYDIGSSICSSAKQLKERIKYYIEKKHNYDIIEVKAD